MEFHEASKHKVVLFIAVSLDGYIADENGDLSWLDIVQTPGEDYGYGALMSSVSTVVMGRRTYDKSLTYPGGFPHKDKDCYVITHENKDSHGQLHFFCGDVTALMEMLRAQSKGTILCEGGGQTIRQLENAGQIDLYIISIIPVLLGQGTLLFPAGRTFRQLELLKTARFKTGLVQLWYQPRDVK